MAWDLVPYTVQTSPVEHELCGGITYVITFNGEPVFDSPNSIPLQYITQGHSLLFFTDDPSLNGINTYTVTGYLSQYYDGTTVPGTPTVMGTATNNIVV